MYHGQCHLRAEAQRSLEGALGGAKSMGGKARWTIKKYVPLAYFSSRAWLLDPWMWFQIEKGSSCEMHSRLQIQYKKLKAKSLTLNFLLMTYWNDTILDLLGWIKHIIRINFASFSLFNVASRQFEISCVACIVFLLHGGALGGNGNALRGTEVSLFISVALTVLMVLMSKEGFIQKTS